MRNLRVKVLQASGDWLDARTILDQGDRYTQQQMKEVKNNFGGKRVKVVDDKGNLVDILD